MKHPVYSVEVNIGGAKFGAVDVIPDELLARLPDRYPQAVALLQEFKDDPFVSSKGIISTFQCWIKRHEVLADNWKRFIEAYEAELDAAYRANPDDYVCAFHVTYGRMAIAILRGSYNKDSATFKAVCKKLGIKHTYKAINAYIFGE